MERIFKKLFILLPNIQMPTTTNFHNTVDTVDTNKKVTLKSVMTTLALFTTLFGKNIAWVAQSTQETKENVKEIVVSIPVQEENDSTIMYNDVKWLENLEEREITPEEIQEYLENHKEEINKEINKRIQDEEICRIVSEELMKNKEIKSIINEMVNDKDIRKAISEWDLEYVQKKLQVNLKSSFNYGEFLEVMWSLFIFIIVVGTITDIIVKISE